MSSTERKFSCPHCGHTPRVAIAVASEPTPGAFSYCQKCRSFSVLGDDYQLTEMTIAQEQRLKGLPVYQVILAHNEHYDLMKKAPWN